jgi:hypothetical protein
MRAMTAAEAGVSESGREQDTKTGQKRSVGRARPAGRPGTMTIIGVPG